MEYPEENALNVYTDGSMLSGPRRGGAAILFVLLDDQGNEEQREEVLAGYAGATQNQMELEAPIQALKMVTGRHPLCEPSRSVDALGRRPERSSRSPALRRLLHPSERERGGLAARSTGPSHDQCGRVRSSGTNSGRS
jgi:RNase H